MPRNQRERLKCLRIFLWDIWHVMMQMKFWLWWHWQRDDDDDGMPAVLIILASVATFKWTFFRCHLIFLWFFKRFELLKECLILSFCFGKHLFTYLEIVSYERPMMFCTMSLEEWNFLRNFDSIKCVIFGNSSVDYV